MRMCILLLVLSACATASKKNSEEAKKQEISTVFPKDNPAGESPEVPSPSGSKPAVNN